MLVRSQEGMLLLEMPLSLNTFVDEGRNVEFEITFSLPMFGSLSINVLASSPPLYIYIIIDEIENNNSIFEKGLLPEVEDPLHLRRMKKSIEQRKEQNKNKECRS